MEALKRLIAVVDRWQRQNRLAGPAYGMIKKFGDDRANLFVVALGWYGFTAIYPLLLVVVTILGFIGEASLGHSIVKTLQQFPVIGTEFKPGTGGAQLHGSVFGLIVGLVFLIYGAQGVTQTASQALDYVWDPSELSRPGFLPRLGRSLGGLILIGLAFAVTSVFASLATGNGHTWPLRVLVIGGLLVLNVGFYLGTFAAATSIGATIRQLVPGAILGGAGFTALTTVGAGLMTRQLRHSSNTYGALASIIGVVTFLLLLGKISMYAAELNPVLARRLWPRALPTTEPTAVDEAATKTARAVQRQTATPGSPVTSSG